LYGYRTDHETGERERFVISEPADLNQNYIYAKERRLIEEIKKELDNGRKVQLFAVYTQKRDVTRRLQDLLRKEGVRVEVLTAETPPEQREAWYERQLRNGMEVCVCHPKLVQTGLDYVEYEAMMSHLFHSKPVGSSQTRDFGARRNETGGLTCIKCGFHGLDEARRGGGS
jgi:superfamily II DNA or RNA helicase